MSANVHVLEAFRKQLEQVRLGRPAHYRNVTLFPIPNGQGSESAYLLLEEGIEAGSVTVTEVEQQGSVPELKVVNEADQPVLILGGEVLKGAKQNRMVNITVLVAARSEFVLPVTCVEQGRWQYVSKAFRATHYASPTLRAKSSRSLHRRRRETGEARSDQGEAWREVAHYLCASATGSPTSSLTDGLDAVEQSLGEYRRNLPLPEGTRGVIVARGEQVVGLDLFDSGRTLERVWDRLAGAYFAEARLDPGTVPATCEEAALGFLSGLAHATCGTHKGLALGEDIEIRDANLVGTALCHADRIVHLAAFALVEER